jgi:hypothetical protein
MKSPACLSILLVLVTACERPGGQASERALAARVFAGVLAYPRSSVVTVSAGPDAAQVVLTTPAPPQTVAAWYRSALPLNGWQLRNDQAMADGSITIYADSGTRPLWITLRANVGAPGTTYTLVGAITVDTAAAPPPPPATRIPAGR